MEPVTDELNDTNPEVVEPVDVMTVVPIVSSRKNTNEWTVTSDRNPSSVSRRKQKFISQSAISQAIDHEGGVRATTIATTSVLKVGGGFVVASRLVSMRKRFEDKYVRASGFLNF